MTVAHPFPPSEHWATPGKMTAEVMPIDPGLAERWLSTLNYERQRTLSEGHAQMLERMIRRTEFKPGAIEFHHCQEHGGHAYLTDGQHRLTAIARAGVPVEMIVIRRYVATYAEVQQAYARTDRGRMRTQRDVYSALALDTELSLTRSQAAVFGAAAVHLMVNFQPYQSHAIARSSDDRVDVMREYADEARALFAVYEGVQGVMHRILLRAMPLAIALATFKHQPDYAEVFWSDLARGEQLSAGTPIYALREYLLNAERSRPPGPRTIMWAIARAWNAHTTHRPLTYFKALDPKRPLDLWGTPYKGKPVSVRA